MAKKVQSKKSAKKAAKKKSAKPAKKAVKKVAKKASKKAAPKKSAKKAVKKSAPKKAAKKVVKKATKKVSKSAKKVAKKVVKKAAPKKAAKKSAPVKKVAKKVVKKVTPKKAAVKKAVSKKRAPKTFMKKVENTFNTIRESVGDFVKDTASTMMDKIAPGHDTPPMDISPSENTGTSGTEHTGSSDEKTEGSDEEEERRPFVKHKTSLKVGDKAPDFSASDQNGNTVTLGSLRGKTVILYFYPKDDTPGCTATACSLRDELDFLSDRNYAVVGVSADDERSHAKFARKYELPFPLLADTKLKICYAYDVYAKKMFMGRITDGIVRTTFIIDANGYIQHVIDSVDTQNHAQQILGLEEEE